jgi:hypothetical protein
MPVYESALEILQPLVPAVLHWRDTHPAATAGWDGTFRDEHDWWGRYCHSMVTVGSQIDGGFHTRLANHPTWDSLVNYDDDQDEPPPEQDIGHCLCACGVRFPNRKARLLVRAWRLSGPGETAVFAQATLEAIAVGGEDGDAARAAELDSMVEIQRQFNRLGVGPKVARLMAIWRPGIGFGTDFRRVVPLDTRWLNQLAAHGTWLGRGLLGRETSYRAIESEICRACNDLQLWPYEADGAVFGWF